MRLCCCAPMRLCCDATSLVFTPSSSQGARHTRHTAGQPKVALLMGILVGAELALLAPDLQVAVRPFRGSGNRHEIVAVLMHVTRKDFSPLFFHHSLVIQVL